MTLVDLVRETIDLPEDEAWENKHTPTPVRVLGVRLHSMGLSVREFPAVLELLAIDRSHGVVWNWTHDLAEAQADPPTVLPPTRECYHSRPHLREAQLPEEPVVECLICWNRSTNAKHRPNCSEHPLTELDV